MHDQRVLRLLSSSFAIAVAAAFASCRQEGSEEQRLAVSTFEPGFALRQDVQLGSGNVTDALVVDLNGDGLSDFVEADFFDKQIRSALGNPDGSFTPFFELGTPSTPLDIEFGDFDGDGNADIAVICTGNNGGLPMLAVYRGYSDGSFAQTSALPLPNDPFHLAVGRLAGFDRDHMFVTLPDARQTWQVELAVAGLERIGTLSSGANIFAPITAAILDANGDGGPDVVVGEINVPETASDRLVTYVFDGATSFAPAAVLAPFVDYPLVRNMGDVDGDGFSDLGVAQLDADGVLLLRGGVSGLEPPLEITFGAGTASILFADLDGDGLKDAAATLFEQDAVAVRLAVSTLGFGDMTVYNVGGFPRNVGTGVFGSGPEVDLFCSNIADVSVLHGDGSGSFEAARGYLIGNEPQFVRAVDFDEDGHLDAVSVDLFQSQLVFMRGLGDGSFENAGQVALDSASVETPGYVIVRDFDGDGRPDVATSVNSADRVQVMNNSGSLPFTDAAQSVGVGFEPLGIDAGDLDGDGHQDIVVANAGDETVQVLLGHGDGTFEVRGPVACPLVPLLPLIGDWNVDGNLDVGIATGSGSNAKLLLYRGDGAGNLALVAQQDLPRFTPTLHIGDFDENGLPDLVGSQPNFGSNEVVVMLNQGNFVFQLRPLEVGFRMGTLEVNDANRDGHLDLLVPLGHGQLVIALGDGNGNFPTLLPPTGEQFPAPRGATTSALADVNGDGLPDLMTVSPRHPYLWVALNRGAKFE